MSRGVAIVAAGLGLTAVLAACDDGGGAAPTAASTATSTGGGDGGAAPATCAESCVPAAPEGFSAPALVWFGDASDDAPDCPETAPFVGFEGFGDLTAEDASCPACACVPAAATCTLPVAWTASSTTCAAQPGGFMTAFDAPAAWDGSCTTASSIAPGTYCGGAECIASLVVHPPLLATGPCAPTAAPSGSPTAPALGAFARACLGHVLDYDAVCPAEDETCVPVAPEGFHHCLYVEGDAACPEAWPARHLVFTDVLDTRGCTACACGEPEGASCLIDVAAFSDGACTAKVASATLSAHESAACVDVQKGTAMGSKSAAVVSVSAGACAVSGGEPTGSVERDGVGTFCCAD